MKLDFDGLKNEFGKVSDDVKCIRSGFSALTVATGSMMSLLSTKNQERE